MANPGEAISRELQRLAQEVSPDSRTMQILLIRIANKIVNDAKKNVAQVLVMRSGKLRRSIGFKLREGGVDIGSFGVPYANIHEFGGRITPKGRKFLTIPQERAFIGRSALNFDLSFGRLDGKPYLFTKQKTAAYRLVRQVTIPARPYLRPAFEENEEFAIDLIRRTLISGQ